MRRSLAIQLILFCCTLACLAAPEPEEEWEISTPGSQSSLSLDWATGEVSATNGVIVRYAGTLLTADKARVNRATGDVEAEGNVRVERRGEVWTGDKLLYNFKTRRFLGDHFRTGQGAFFASGVRLESQLNDQTHTAESATVTTDDYAEPGYSIRAKRITFVPGRYIRAHNATFYAGNVPVLYLPSWTRSLRRHSNYWVLLPGYRSRFGPYLLSSYHYQLDEHLQTSVDLDYRLKRGFGFGPQVEYQWPGMGKGEAKYYRTHDEDPGLDPFRRPIDDERQRLWFQHQAEWNTNLTLKATYRYQSDDQVVRDFFEAEYRRNVQPASYVELQKSWRNWSLNTLVQPRVNDFFETVERLPDVQLTGLRQQLGSTPVYYESVSAAGYYRRRFAENTQDAFGALRADTYHQLLLPRTFFNWLHLTPRVGGRLTYYGEVDGRNSTQEDQRRFVFNTGAELSTKASRVWPGVENRFFHIHGLRHILEPSINYAFVPSPDRNPPQLPQFDYEIPSRRLLPIDYPDYNAIDSVDSQNILRLGLRNKLQTKRHGQVEDVVAWAVYTDWRLKPRTGQGSFSDLFSDLDLIPFRWLSLSSELRYSLDDSEWREANHYVTLLPHSSWSLSVGHRYLKTDPTLGPDSGNNLFSTRFYYRLSENWGFRASHFFEARDGRMEEQLYAFYRDFRSWTGALTFRVRESRNGDPRDFSVGAIFNLKAFPRFKRGDDVNQPSLLFGN